MFYDRRIAGNSRYKDTNGTLEALVRSLSQSFVSGYMMTVGLKNEDSLTDGKNAKTSPKK